MRLSGTMGETIRYHLKRLRSDVRGNIGMTFALVAVPLMLGVGASIDYVRAYNVRQKMQQDLDAGLLAAVKHVDDLSEAALEEKVKNWFSAQTDLDATSYTITDVEVDTSKTSISAKATASVSTTFMRIANIEEVPVTVTSAVTGPASSYIEINIVLDKSPSMLLAASKSDQALLRADKNITCEFGCHSNDDSVSDSSGKKLANNYYDYMKNYYGVELRADVANSAAKSVVSYIEDTAGSSGHVKIGLYKMGQTAEQVLAPTPDFSDVDDYLDDDSYGLTSATSEDGTYFDKSMTALKKLIGEAGDGSSEDKPLKLVLLLTDGIQSERNWVLWENQPNYDVLHWNDKQNDTAKQRIWQVVTPINPDWCDYLKDNDVTVGVLYTEYLAIPSDWGYNATVGKTMKSSRYKSTWGGTMRSTVSSSTTRRDYIPYALEDCASSSSLFVSADTPEDIEDGLQTIFSNYLSKVRLTQ